MKTASEVMVEDWVASSAAALRKYIEHQVVDSVVNSDYDSIDDNSCEHCGAYIPDWETEDRTTPTGTNGFAYYGLIAAPDRCIGRLCGCCEVQLPRY